MTDAQPMIRVKQLTKHLPVTHGLLGRSAGVIHAVDQVPFDILAGETLGLVGESGCGKFPLGRTILQLYRPTAGQVFFGKVDLATLNGPALGHMRQQLQIIFQDPFSSLNPRKKVGDIIAEPHVVHSLGNVRQRRERVLELLYLVGLRAQFADRFPHEFSGGQRQRIGVARALVSGPRFVVCDEPISALDVSIQAQIINLLKELQQRLQLTYLFFAHDLSIVHHVSDRLLVMYLGRAVELAPRAALYAQPRHPNTKALLSAIPEPDPVQKRQRTRVVLKGGIPNPTRPPAWCRFHTRCPIAEDMCVRHEPEWREVDPGHWVACHKI